MSLETPLTVSTTSANYRLYFAQLCRELPPVPGEDGEARAARQKGAMDAFVSLNPDTAFEAQLANRIVTADAHAADALASAAQAIAADNPDEVRRCRAQAASMARTSDSALRALLRMQIRREKLEAEMNPAAMEQAGYWFRRIEPTAPPPAEPPPDDDAEPVRTQAQIDADAKLYAIMYPDRVARIREAGGLPPRLDFGPPEPEIVAALLRLTDRDAALAAQGATAPMRKAQSPATRQ